MIEQILPAGVASAVLRAHDSPMAPFPEEASLMRHAGASRWRDFAGGRSCARLALAELGVPRAPIMKGDKGEPLWPEGVVGSITHCRGYCAAAVARQHSLGALGIDAEPHEALPTEVHALILGPEERAWVRDAPRGIHWQQVIFSIKESIYKAVFPALSCWIDFHDVCIVRGAELGMLVRY